MSGFLHIFPAAPGWRILYVEGPRDDPEFWFSPIVAFAELEDSPGNLVAIRLDGHGFSPLTDEEIALDSSFFGFLQPGEEPDMGDKRWRTRLGFWFDDLGRR